MGRKPYASPDVESKRKIGRPGKFSLDLFLELLRHLGRGMYQSEAAARVGIETHTLSAWKGEGWQIGTLDFSSAIEKAVKEYQVSLIEKIEAHPSWQAKAWILERRWPRLFGQNRAPTPDEVKQEPEQWLFKAAMGDDGYFVVPIGGKADVVESWHAAKRKQHADTTSPEPEEAK